MNPNATNHPISYFKRFHDDDMLDLSPTFQRNAVWSDSQASYLLDSILNQLPMPEIFVRSMTTSGGDTRLEVVDGQQRLRSIIRFYQGDLELAGDDVTEDWRGTSFSDLEKDERERFWAYKIVTRELEAASDAEVRDMFRRLNANQSSLNSQELRHSQYHGEFTTTVESLADDSWWLQHRLVTPAQVRRMLDVEFISELMVGLIQGPLDKKKGLEEFYQEFDDEFPDRDYWVDLFSQTRALATKLVSGNFKGWRSKTEFYTLFLAAGDLVYEEEKFATKRLSNARNRLSAFGDQVATAKKKGASKNFPQRVLKYVDAATRASTDLSRRELRIATVKKVIMGG
jgi:hypothetical protein